MLFAHLQRILKLDRLRLRVRTAPKTSSSSPLTPSPPASWPSLSPCRLCQPPSEGQGSARLRRARQHLAPHHRLLQRNPPRSRTFRQSLPSPESGRFGSNSGTTVSCPDCGRSPNETVAAKSGHLLRRFLASDCSTQSTLSSLNALGRTGSAAAKLATC